MRRPARRLEDDQRIEHGADGWRTAERKLELDALADRQAAEAPHEARRADVEAAGPRRRRDDDGRSTGAAHFGAERAAVERVEAHAPPPPAGAGREERNPDEARAGRSDAERSHDAEGDEEQKRMHAREVRRSEAEAERRRTEMRRGEPHGHGTTRPRRFSIRAGPIPGIASSSSTDLNGPCACR